ALCARRRQEEKTFLRVVSCVLAAQRKAGRHASMEHPHCSAAWRTKRMSRMRGCVDARIDRCATGLKVWDEARGRICAVRKSTRIRTTSASMAQRLSECRCQCSEPHSWPRREDLKDTQNYEEGFVKILAESIQETWRCSEPCVAAVCRVEKG